MTREEEIKQAANSFTYVIRDCATSRTEEDFIQGAKWADEHPKSGLVDVDGACGWLMDNLQTYSEMTPLMIDFFVGAFKNFCEQKKQKVITG